MGLNLNLNLVQIDLLTMYFVIKILGDVLSDKKSLVKVIYQRSALDLGCIYTWTYN